MRLSRKRAVLACALSLSLFAAACGSDEDSTSDTTATQDTTAATEDTTAPAGGEGDPEAIVVYAAEQEYTSYNNGAADQGLFSNTLVLNQLLPGPIQYLPDLTNKTWEPVAKSVTVTSEDPLTIEYVLQEAAVWSDGEPIDCDDFWLAWRSSNGKDGNRKDEAGKDAVDEEGNPVPVWNTASTTGYEDVESLACSEDGKTITATFSKVFADWKVLFGGLLPAHVVERESGVADLTAELSAEDLIKVADFWNTGFVGFKPEIHVSGGPFVMTEFKTGQSLTLERNPKWFGEPAKAAKIVYQMVPDATAQPAALQNGEVDVITPQPNTDLVEQIKAIEGVNLQFLAGTVFEHYDLNLKNEHLASLKVRQALAACIDREEIVETMYRNVDPGAQVLNNRIFMPDSPYYKDGSGDFAAQDIDKAKALLEEDGYVLGDDGFYAKDGKKLSLRLGRRDPNERRQQQNELFIEQCKAAGIELTDDASEDFNAVRLPAGDYDIALFAWVATPALSSNNSIYLPPEQGGGQNWINYVNEDLVPLFDSANTTLDEAARADIYNQVDQILWDDMVTIPLVQWTELYASAGNVGGVVPNSFAGVTWNAETWTKTAQ